MEKICLITHVADADGAFPIILAKLAFDLLDVYSCELSEVDTILKDVLNHCDIYEKIYIVDLNISEEMAESIEKDELLRNKVMVFDHHISNMPMNRFSFIQVIDEKNGIKECGTSLFYHYLKTVTDCPFFDKAILKTMVELVRQGDTFDFSEELREVVFHFGSLYSIYGRDKYIDHFYKAIIERDTFSFSEIEKELIEIEQEKTNVYIAEKMQHVKKTIIMGVRVGIVFAEQKRSLLGHAMAENLDIDIAIIIDVDRSVSYRASKDDVDVSVIAIPHHGGGHKHASGSPLPIDLQEKICELIFKEISWQVE